MTIERSKELASLSPRDKILHWAESKPWAGVKLPNKTEIGQNKVLLDADNNIIRMPLLVGKSCFGQPTAYARHGGNLPYANPRFGTVPSRCMRCKSKAACEQVAKKRLLTTTDEIKLAWISFSKAGGGWGLKNPTHCPKAEQEFNGLVHALCRHGGFSNTNDQAILDHYELERSVKLVKDKIRKRNERRKNIKTGKFDAAFLSLLEDHRFWRMAQLKLHLRSEGMPRQVLQMPEASAEVTADAWQARLMLTLQNATVNASSVARLMLELWPKKYESHNVLRQRVKNDLRRVDILEKLILPNRVDVFWPPFDLTSELSHAELHTPYTDS